jgi:putative transposase
MSELHENTIIEWLDDEYKTKCLERILWVSLEDDLVFVINITEEKIKLPFARSYEEIIDALNKKIARKSDKEPFINFLNPSEYYIKEHGSNRDRYWNALRDILEMEPDIFISDKRGPLIKIVIDETGISERDIYKKIKQFWKYGKKPNGLLPEYIKSGGKGNPRKIGEKKLGRKSKKSKENPELIGVNVTEDDKKIFGIAIKNYFEKSNKPSLKDTYRKMISTFYNQGFHEVNGALAPILAEKEDVPNIRQFKYWYHKEFTSKEKINQKHGEKNQQLKHRSLSSNATKRAQGPGAMFEIDATVADIYLVSSLVRYRIIGRPVIYIVKDVFSRMVTGVYVGLVGPSWEAAMMALENVTTNKKEYCNKLGIPITDEEWPSHHLPKAITADRGEFEGHSVENYINELGVKINNTPPYRADLKGIVEQHFNIVNTKIKEWLPGAVHKDYLERGARDYRLDAKLTLKSFERIIVLSILEHNKKIIKDYPLTAEMIKAGVEPTPINLWRWGIKGNGMLKEVDRNLVRSTLMPRSTAASITRRGISFKGKEYSSSYAIEQGWCDEVSEKGRKKVEIYFDNRNANFIYLRKPDGTFDECKLINDLKFSEDELEPRIEDVEEYEYISSINTDKNEFHYEQITADTNAQIVDIIEKEIEKTDGAQIPGQSKASKLESISQNKRIEIENIRQESTWTESDEPKEMKDINYKDHNTMEDEESDSRNFKKNIFAMLKKQTMKRDKAQ